MCDTEVYPHYRLTIAAKELLPIIVAVAIGGCGGRGTLLCVIVTINLWRM